jgi:WD40 repeat protein
MQSTNSHAKFKYLRGEVLNSMGTITNLSIPDAGIEGNMITGNDKFVAIPWKAGGGGCVHVRKIEDSGRVPNMDTPLLLGHKGLIQDLSFSPHNSTLLATASADSTVKLWNI